MVKLFESTLSCGSLGRTIFVKPCRAEGGQDASCHQCFSLFFFFLRCPHAVLKEITQAARFHSKSPVILALLSDRQHEINCKIGHRLFSFHANDKKKSKRKKKRVFVIIEIVVSHSTLLGLERCHQRGKVSIYIKQIAPRDCTALIDAKYCLSLKFQDEVALTQKQIA